MAYLARQPVLPSWIDYEHAQLELPIAGTAPTCMANLGNLSALDISDNILSGR